MKRRMALMVALVATWLLAADMQAGYVVKFADMAHCTWTAQYSGAPFSGGDVQTGKTLTVTYTANPGWLFSDNDATVYVKSKTLDASSFDSQGVYLIEQPNMYGLTFDIRWVGDGSAAKIMWEDKTGELKAYRLMVSEAEDAGNPAYWKNVYTTSQSEQEVTGLAVGHKYYAHLQVGTDAEHMSEDIFIYEFYARPSLAPCGIYFHLKDSYGDGWGPSDIEIAEKDESTTTTTTITLVNGGEEWTEYVSNDKYVTITWRAGDNKYLKEISFDILKGDGTPWISIANAATDLTDGQVLFSGYLCSYPCDVTVDNLDFTSNDAKTAYTLTWDAKSVEKYEVAVLQKMTPTEAEIEKAIKTVTTNSYKITGKANSIQHVYVRAVCSDGQKGKWTEALITDPYEIIGLQEDLPKLSKTIKLPYSEKGDYIANAIGTGPSKTKWTPYMFYHFKLAEDTKVMFFFDCAEESYGITFLLYRDPGDGSPYTSVGVFAGGAHDLTAGDYYLAVEATWGDGYTLKITKAEDPQITDIKALNFYDAGDFSKAKNVDISGATVPAKIFRYTPETNQNVIAKLCSDNHDGAVKCRVYAGEFASSAYIDLMVASTQEEYPMSAGTSYYFAVYTSLYDYGHTSDSYQFLLAAKNTEPTPAKRINLDAHVEDSFGKNDVVNEIGKLGKVYEFVVKEDVMISYSYELLGEHANDPDWIKGTGMLIYKDGISDTPLKDWSLNVTQYVFRGTFTGSTEGTHYYVVMYNNKGINTEYRLNLRAMTPANDIRGKETIEVNKGYQRGLSVLDPFRGNNEGIGSTSGTYGTVEYYTVHLDASKQYMITARKLDAISTEDVHSFAITVLDPTKSGTFAERTVKSSTSLHNGWEVVNFTPTAAGDYTLVFGAKQYKASSKDTVAYEFSVNNVKEVQNAMSEAIKVTSDELPYQKDGVFSGNRENLPSATYHFMENGTSWIQQNGAYDALPLLVTVHAGDSLYVEFGGDEDVSIYIYAGSSKTPIIVNNVPYAYPYEKYGLKNTTSGEQTYYILGAYNNPRVQAAPFYVRLYKHAGDIAPVTVSAKCDKSSITIGKSEGVAEAQEALGKLVLTAVNSAGKQVCTLANIGYLWQVDLDANKAYYELNDSDLPMGLTFGEPNTIAVTIKRNKVNIEEVEISSERDDTVRKILREGRVLIITPYGTFDMMGRRVQEAD